MRRRLGKLGMVFQEPRLLPWRTVAQNLRLAGAPDATDADLDDLFAALGLAKHRDHFPGELSLGLAQAGRASRAPSRSSLTSFCSTSLSSRWTRRSPCACGASSSALVETRKATTLIVTHDVEEAISLADRIIVLSGAPGRMVAERIIEAPRLALTQARAATIKSELASLIEKAAS